jgi:hypothetical protein
VSPGPSWRTPSPAWTRPKNPHMPIEARADGQPGQNLWIGASWSGKPLQQRHVEELTFYAERIVAAPLKGDVGEVVEGARHRGPSGRRGVEVVEINRCVNAPETTIPEAPMIVSTNQLAFLLGVVEHRV